MSNTHGLQGTKGYQFSYTGYYDGRWPDDNTYEGSWINNVWVANKDRDKKKAKEVVSAEIVDELDDAEVSMLEELRLDYWDVTAPLFQLISGVVKCGECWDTIDWDEAECSCTAKFDNALAKQEEELNETGKLLLYEDPLQGDVPFTF